MIPNRLRGGSQKIFVLLYADLELVLFCLGLECLPKRRVANVQLAGQPLHAEPLVIPTGQEPLGPAVPGARGNGVSPTKVRKVAQKSL